MSKSSLHLGSLCLSDIVEQAKKGHSAFSRGKNGKVYFNVAIWKNKEPDQYGNDIGVQLSSTKEKKTVEKTVYIGNAKEFKTDANTPLNARDLSLMPDMSGDDGLPF